MLLPLSAIAQSENVDRFREFYVGGLLEDLLFDGTYIWVADYYDDTVSKLDPVDGTVLATYPTMGTSPRFLAFDGTNIWISHYGMSGTVTKLRASDGAFLGSFYIGEYPADLVYADGRVWVATGYGGSILRATDGKIVGGFGGYGGLSVTFDGENVWVTNSVDDSVMKYRASDTSLLGEFPVGDDPVGVGVNNGYVWVANFDDHTVTKLLASDGSLIGSFPSGALNPERIAFDPEGNVWVTHFNRPVTILKASDGSVKQRYPYLVTDGITSSGPNIWVTANYESVARFATDATKSYRREKFQVDEASALTFDGANIWVTQDGLGMVIELRATDGSVVGVFPAGGSLNNAITFDGTYIWVVNYGDAQVTRLLQRDGSMQGSFPVGELPTSILFDGANIWVTNAESNNVTKLRASDGALLGTFNVGSFPRGLAFDGKNIWVTNMDSDTVTELRGSDGARLGTVGVGDEPYGVAFDGAHIWVSNDGSDTLTEIQSSDRSILRTTAVGHNPRRLAVDATHLFVATSGGNTIEQYNLGDASYQHNFGFIRLPEEVLFDGRNIWETSALSGVLKLNPKEP